MAALIVDYLHLSCYNLFYHNGVRDEKQGS